MNTTHDRLPRLKQWGTIISSVAALALLGFVNFSPWAQENEPESTAIAEPTAAPPGDVTPLPTPTPTRWQSVRSWAFQLQGLDIDRAASSKFDLIVTDYSADGSEQRRHPADRVARLKTGPNGPRLVVAYLSIGEAETYRYYWRHGWRPGNPSWLQAENPRWPGNYPVAYWEPQWKAIIFGSPESYLDKIIDLGYDGVYLDIVDAYQHFERDRPSARQEMVQFVQEIAHHARVTRGKADFGVFPQNGEPLIDIPGFLEVVTGVGKEETYYGNPRDDVASPPDFTVQTEGFLDRFVAAGKVALILDYTQRQEQIADAYTRARARGYVPYATVRALNRLVVNRGFDPE